MTNGTLSVALDGMLLGGPFSGVEEAILGLARSLAQSGRHKYKFFIPYSCSHADAQGPSFATERVRIPHSRLTRLIWEQLRLPRIAEREHCDLIHAPAYLAPLSARIPVVLTVYDLQALLHPQFCLPLNRLNYRMMLPRSIRMARGLIVPSASVARDMTRLFPEVSDRLAVIPLGINPAFHIIDVKEKATALAALGISEPFILFAGNMAPNKNLPTLISAFGMMKRDKCIPHKLVLAGRDMYQHQDIHRCIREEGLSEEIIFTGYVSELELVALYNAADVFAFPSLYEGFGLPPLEAMACGTPVVCSNIASLKETVGPAARLVDPVDPAALAYAVAELVTNREMHSEMAQSGLQHVKIFTWANAMLQTEKFYEKISSSA